MKKKEGGKCLVMDHPRMMHMALREGEFDRGVWEGWWCIKGGQVLVNGAILDLHAPKQGDSFYKCVKVDWGGGGRARQEGLQFVKGCR